jgi:glycosyltransferase involved in cell wall biosynthesis
VIVACFNVAEFVPACLRSIFHQPQVDRLKVLVVDDGSMDNTPEVVRAQIAAHPNVNCELVIQPNQGLSGARNTGLRAARTTYVTFVDGDDLWAENYLELVGGVMDEGRADIIAFNASIVDMTGRQLHSLHVHTRFSREARFSCSELASDAATLGEWQAWARIYKTRLLNGVRFPQGRYYEDAAVLPSLYATASHIETLKEELYLYRRRPGSLTSYVTDKHIDDLMLNAREAEARITEESSYWKTVRENIVLRIARDVGRAPRELRRSLFSRVWPDVQLGSNLSFKLNWILVMLDACLRSEVKRLLGLNGSLVGSRVFPTTSNAPE